MTLYWDSSNSVIYLNEEIVGGYPSTISNFPYSIGPYKYYRAARAALRFKIYNHGWIAVIDYLCNVVNDFTSGYNRYVLGTRNRITRLYSISNNWYCYVYYSTSTSNCIFYIR